MPEYHELIKETREAEIGADRMAMGLSCIPDPLRGDMIEVARLRTALRRIASCQRVHAGDVVDLARVAIGQIT